MEAELQDLARWAEARYGRMTAPAAGLSPVENGVTVPFTAREYAHLARIPSVGSPEWSAMARTRVPSPDPYTRSPVRDGYLAWDFVAVPRAPVYEGVMADLKTVRNINTDWAGTREGLSRAGLLRVDGRIERPGGRWILDYAARPDGWDLLGLAHWLAHRYAPETDERSPYVDRDGVRELYPLMAARLAVALLLDLPVDVDNPRLLPHGIDVRCNVGLRNPGLRVSAFRDPPVPDTSLVVVQTAVHIEPPPGLRTRVSTRARWACQPAVVVVTGWESFDVVSRAVLMSGRRDLLYAATVEDLEPPDGLRYVLQLAALAGSPRAGVAPHEAVAAVKPPPWPCRSCLRTNPGTVDAPVRPRGRYPGPGRVPVWDEYCRAMEALYRSVLAAAETVDRRLDPRMRRRREARRAALTAERARREAAARERVLTKVATGKGLTPRQQILWNRMKQEQTT
jgi:hypothetical protein